MASLIDNPDAFFNEILSESPSEPAKKKEVSEQPQKVEPTLAPITEAGPLAEPKREVQAPTNESPQKEAPSLVSNPEGFFKSIGESENPETPEEPKYDSADYLAAATKDLDSEAVVNKYGEAINSMSPEAISKFQKMRPDLILPRDVWAKGYAVEKSKPMQILPSKKELGEMIYSKSPEGEIGGLAGTLKKLALGARDVAVDVFDPDPAANQRLATDVKSFVAPVVGLPEEVIWTGTKMAQGGTQITDWALGRSDEEKEENAYQRHIVDAAREQARKASRNNIYERMLTSPTMVIANKAILSRSGPSVSDIMAAYPEMSKEEAAAYRENTLNQQALELAKENAASQLPLNANVEELGTWFTPGGLGMGEFGLLMNAPRFAKGLGKLAESKLLTKAEIGAKRAAEFETAEAGIASDIEKAQKPSLAGATADAVLRAQENLSKFAEANPKLARLGEVALEYAPAGILGYEATGSSPGGALAGLASVAIGKKIGLGKALTAAPQLVSDLDKARRIAAGGKVGMYEMAGALPESSAVTRALFGGGRGAFTDKFANAAADYVAEGVNVSALGLATGLINSEDTEALRQSMATGLMYGLGFKTIHKVFGKDAAADERRQKQEDVDNRMTLEAMDPNTRNNVLAGTEWNNVVEKSKRQMDVAQTEYEIAQNSGDAAAAKEAADRLRMLQAVHERNVTASVQTRQAYGREVLKTLTAGHELLNGTMRAGQKNAGISVLTTRQIYDQLKSRPENAGKTDAQLWEAASNVDGIYYNNEGNQVTDRKKAGAQEGQFENIVFDPFKPTVVVNADKVKERMGALGKSYHEAMTHELGHALNAVPEFREANKSAEESLFGIQRVDLAGNVETFKPGVFTPAKLVELFANEYLGKKGYTPAKVIEWAKNNGMWDETNQRLNEAKIAPYMKEEIMAGLTGTNLMPDVKETGIRHMLDWASIQAQNNIVARAINKTIGYGGKLPHEMFKDENSGVTFTPQQLASNKEALKQIRKLNGMLSSPISDGKSAPSISKMELLANKGLWKRYAQDSGLFKTEIRATIYDANGAAIGSELVADVNAKEGSWSSTPEGPKKDSGYGDLPAGIDVPEGGSVRITRELVMGPDGQTPQMLSPKEAKDLQTARTGLIRDAVINAYDGEEGGFRATSEDGLSFKGTFTAKQMQALRDLPESIVPKSVKDVILRMNTLVAEKAGQRMFIDYAAMMNDNGKYKAFAPKIYEIVPLSMGLSKEGNFYVVSASVTRLNEKLKAWQERLPGRLSLWNGNADAFFSDFANIYLKNWQEGRPGDSGLDADPKVAMQKKTIFADYLNFATKDTAELHDQTSIPRKRGDARDKDMNRIIMSVRADHVRDMLESTNIPLPIDYLKGKYNLKPSRKDVAEEGGLGYKESPTIKYREPKYETTKPPRLGYIDPRTTEEGRRVLSESPILAQAYDALEGASEAGGDQRPASGSSVIPEETEALREFANRSGAMESPEAVQKFTDDWNAENRTAGTEHQVLFGDRDRIEKRFTATSNDTWKNYLDRILLHNILFKDSAIKLEGFQEVPEITQDRNGQEWNPGLYAKISQPYAEGKQVDLIKDLKPYMESLGFVSNGPMNYYHPEYGVHVSDLHPGNAYVETDAQGNKHVTVFDPNLHLTGEKEGDAKERARVEAKLATQRPAEDVGFSWPKEVDDAIDRMRSVLDNPENMPTQVKPEAPLPVNLYEAGTSLESFGLNSLKEIAEHYGFTLPEKAKRGEIIDLVENQKSDVQFKPARKDAMPQSSMASPMADDIIRTPVNRQAAQGLAFKPAKKIEGAEEIEAASGFQKVLTKSGKWSVYNPDNLLATGKQFDTPEAADKAAKVIADANEPVQGIPYSLQEGRTGKWKIIDKKGEAAVSKTFSNPTEAADYAVALHRESLPLSAVKKFMLKADRDAVTEAEQRIADMQAKNPEAMPLVVARDGDTGLPKIDLLEDAEGNPVLDEKGKQARGVIYRQVPYRLRQSPMLDAKDDNVAVQQAADLMTPEVQTAMADPSVAKAIGWYKQMRKQLQQYYGANIELFGQLLGATSARTPVDENFKRTIEAARQYSKGAYDTLLQEFHEHIVQATEDLASGALQERWEKKNPTKTWNQEKDGTDALRMEINKFSDVPLRSNGTKFNANSQKVLHALYGNWLSQTVGPKTPNFAGNLTRRTLRATIDVWAARNLRRLLYDDGTSQWRLLPEQEKGVDSAYNAKGELTGDFPFAQNVYDEVASRVKMNADDLQALMWFYEKGIWDQNGWTGALGAKTSSFEEEAEKLSLDRYQAGVTAYTNEGDYPNLEEFTLGVQEKTRKELRDSIGQLPGVEISRVTHTDGLYGGSVEPSLDVEFSVSRDKSGKPQSIASVIDRLKVIGKEQNQYDTFISQLVDKEHPNARPMVEIGFKNAAKPEEVDAVVEAFRGAGIDGFTLAKDSKGNVIGIRAQYIPEISSRWDEDGRADLLDPERHGESSQNWADKARQAINSLGDQENVSYKNEGYVSTHVYGKEEYDAETSPQDLLGSDVRDQLGRRKRILEALAGEGQVPSGIGSD